MALDTVEGYVEDKFGAVRDAFEANLASGADLGASFCATMDGEMVVDLWGGWADEAKTRPWERDTIVNVYSTTKTMTVALRADAGRPRRARFRRAGRQVLAGVRRQRQGGGQGQPPDGPLGRPLGLDGADHQAKTSTTGRRCASLLAAQAPLLGAGDRSPATTPSPRATWSARWCGASPARRIGTFFREEIAEPLGADFWIGLPASEDARVADLIPPPPGGGDRRPGAERAAEDHARTIRASTCWRPAPAPGAARRSRPPAAPATPARSPQIHAILANGGVAKGKRFMSEAGCRKALELQIEGTDLILGMPVAFGMGFGLAGATVPAAQSEHDLLGRLRRLADHHRHGRARHLSPTR